MTATALWEAAERGRCGGQVRVHGDSPPSPFRGAFLVPTLGLDAVQDAIVEKRYTSHRWDPAPLELERDHCELST